MTNPKDEIRTALKGVGLAKVKDDILSQCEFLMLPAELVLRFCCVALRCCWIVPLVPVRSQHAN